MARFLRTHARRLSFADGHTLTDELLRGLGWRGAASRDTALRAPFGEAPADRDTETSDFTRVQDRIADRQSSAEVTTADAQGIRTEHGEKAGWLSPVALEPPRKKVREKATTRRASNQGCLPMTLGDYLALLDWTGRQIRREKGKQGHIRAETPAILERLKCDATTWMDYVKNFRQRFRNEAGLATSRRSFRNARMTSRQLSNLTQ